MASPSKSSSAPLSVVGRLPTVEPPFPLGPAGLGLWDSILADFTIEDSAGLAMLAQAAAVADRAAMLAEVVARDGPIIMGKNRAPRTNPAVRDEISCRSFIVRTLQRLGVNMEPVRASVGRPPAAWKPRA